MYKLNLNSTSIARISDGASIPNDPQNTDYAQYLAWLSEGNTATPADLPDPKLAIQSQIAALEAMLTVRRMREALLTGDHTFVAGVDTQIAALRKTL